MVCKYTNVPCLKQKEGEHTPSSLPALTRLRAQYFDGGDAWYTPLFKITVDQTAWSVAWNSLYYVLLGERAVLLHSFRQPVTTHGTSSRTCPFKQQESVVPNSRKVEPACARCNSPVGLSILACPQGGASTGIKMCGPG